MKYVAGFGLLALTVCLGCSGTSRTTQPKNDAGEQTDAGQQADTGELADAANQTDAADSGQGEAGAAGEASCTAGTYSCAGQTLRLCSASGVPELNRQCAADEYCDDRRALCVAQICTPGATSCDGAKVRVCNDAGSDFTVTQTCSLSQTCNAGTCQDIGCVPDTTFCSGGSVWMCGTDGTTSTLAQHCTSDQFCFESDRVATCSATVCVAGAAMCDGNVATQCKPDGSGPEPGGNDCTQSTQTCYSGQCSDLVCTPGQKLCDNNSAYLCADAGTSRTLLTTCAAGETCDASSGSCQAHVCDPGTLSCDSTRIVTCNSSGSGYVQSGPDCATTKGICQSGACKPLICTPQQIYCQNDNVVQCSLDGTSSTLYSDCVDANDHCVPVSSYAYCYPQFCQPSAAGCNGNLLTTCTADGNAWASGGTDCTLSNSVCANAKCMAKVCTPYATFCSGGNVQQCDYQGLTSAQAQFCAYGTYCQAQLNAASCVPTPCLPDTDGCASEKFGHCAADGMSIATVVTDCGAASQVCTLQGCAASATDTLASSNQLGAGAAYSSLIANVINVQSPRKLTTIEMYLSLPSTSSLVWVVYQQNVVNGSNEFDLKYEKTTSATGTGFQSSGAFSLELAAGTTYAIGVSVTGGNFVYYYDTVTPPVSLNFAHATGQVAGSFGTTLYAYGGTGTGALYYSRLTTAAP
jgi:hypothetical protein